jgi:hypothetical protein
MSSFREVIDLVSSPESPARKILPTNHHVLTNGWGSPDNANYCGSARKGTNGKSHDIISLLEDTPPPLHNINSHTSENRILEIGNANSIGISYNHDDLLYLLCRIR